MTAGEVDLLVPRLECLEDGVTQRLLGLLGDPLGAYLAAAGQLDDRGARLTDPVLLYFQSVLLWIQDLVVEVARQVFVFLEEILEAQSLHLVHEGLDLDELAVLRQRCDELFRLVVQREQLVLGQVDAVMVPVAQEVQQPDHHQRQGDPQPGGRQVGQAPAPLARNDPQAGQGHRQRHEHHCDPEDPVALTLGEGNRVVSCLLGTDRDQALVLGQPAQRVEHQVAVPLVVEELVGGKVRVAENHQPAGRFVLLALGPGRRRQGDRSGQIYAVVQLDRSFPLGLQHAQIGLRPSLVAGLDQLDPFSAAAPREPHRTGQLEEGHQTAVLLGDRMVPVVHRHGRGVVQAEQRTDTAGVDDEIVAHLHAPIGQQSLQAALVERIQQDQHRSAPLQVAAHRLDLVGQERSPRAGDDQHCAVLGHGGFPGQKQRIFDRVVDLFEALPKHLQSLRFLSQTGFAVTDREIDHLPPVAKHLQQGIGDLLLLQFGDLLLLAVGLDHQGVVLPDAVFLGASRLPVRVDELVAETRTVNRVPL